jgi:hypothetical protein
MKVTIKKNKISFKIGSLQWSNFFGLPIALIVIGLMPIIFIIKDPDDSKNNFLITYSIVNIILGIVTYYIQKRRLIFKTLKVDKDVKVLKTKIRDILNNNQWKINCDNQLYLQASYSGSLYNSDMLTLKFKKSEIQWNIIHHPHSMNSFASLFTLNKQGNIIMKKIMAATIQ